MLRVLKLYVVVNNSTFYELEEDKPITIETTDLPIIIFVKNGFHFSKEITINSLYKNPTLIGVGCKVDNIAFLGSLFFTLLLFAIALLTKNRLLMYASNLPILIFIYLFFLTPKKFITLTVLNKN